MRKPSALVAHLWSDQSGTTAIEYALIAMLIAIALVTMFTNLGTEINSMWNSVSTKVDGAS